MLENEKPDYGSDPSSGLKKQKMNYAQHTTVDQFHQLLLQDGLQPSKEGQEIPPERLVAWNLRMTAFIRQSEQAGKIRLCEYLMTLKLAVNRVFILADEMNLRPEHLADWKRSGISDESIVSSNVRSVTREEANTFLQFNPGCDGWAITYPNLNGHKESFIRFKPDKPFRDVKGREAKYLTAKGAGNRLYIPVIYKESDLLHSTKPIIFVEGEKKAIAGAEKLPGFVVLGLAGVWCFKTEKQALIPDFKEISWKDRMVYVCFDSDIVGKPQVADAEKAFSRELDRLGAIVQLCRLPGNGTLKVGLDDYLLTHSAETFVEQILDKALLWTNRGNLEVDDLESFCVKSIPREEEIVGGGLLPAKGMLTIAGYSKMGKSVLAMNLGLCIASGKPFLLQFPVAKPRRVLCFNEEISQQSMQDRAKKMRGAAKSSSFGNFSSFKLVSKTGIKLDSDEGLKAAMRLIRIHKPDVCIWDCLYRLHLLNENLASDMGRLMDKFDYLTRLFSVAHILVHHFGNPAKDSDRQGFQLLRGSSVLGAYGDSFVTLNPYKRNQEGNRYQKAAFTLRNAETPDDLVVSRNPETLWYEVVKITDPDGKLNIGNVIFALKELGGNAKRTELSEKLISDFKVCQRTVDSVIADAVKLSRIGKSKETKNVEYFCHV